MPSPAVNFIQRHRRPLIGTLVGIVIAAIFIFEPRITHGYFGEATINNALARLMYFAIEQLAKLLVVVINIMTSVAQYNTFLAVDAVERGWAIVRDVCNMFFIVVLLIIAFGTILRLENYRYNKLLARLIVMAILVNFSKFIAGFFIDFSQVIMLTFVSSWRDIAGGNITYALGLQDIVNLSTSTTLGDVTNAGPLLGALALGLVLITIAVVVMVIIAIVLLLRILALWFLVVLSPLAFLLRTYPSSEKYASRWWQEFGKYTVTGPVVAFLLWLTLAIISQPTDFSKDVFISRSDEATVTDTTTPADDAETRITAAVTTIGSSGALLRYMMGIMLLVGTLVITKELGVAGGQLAGQAASRIQGFATKAATLAAGVTALGAPATAAYLARKPILAASKTVGKVVGKGVGNAALDWAERKTGAILRPSEWIEGFKRGGKRRHERSREAVYRKALDRWRGTTKEVAVKKWAFGKKKTFGFIPRPSREQVGTKTVRDWHPIQAMAAMPEFARVNFLTPEGLMAAAGGRFRKYRDATNQQDRGKAELQRLVDDTSAASMLERPEQYAVQRHAQIHLMEEMERRRTANEGDANYRVTKDEHGTETREHIDDVMRAQGIDVHADPATDPEKRRFLKQWDQELSEKLPEEVRGKVLQQGVVQYMSSGDITSRVQEGQQLLREDAEKKRQEAANYTGPNARLTDKTKEEKNKQLEEIKKQLARIDADIKAKEAAGAPHADLLTQREEMKKQADHIGKYLTEGKAENEDKVISNERGEKLLKDAGRLDESATRGITDSDMALMNERVGRKREEVRMQGDEVSKYRLPTPFELHNEFRQAINEKMKQLQSDDWHEINAVFEDAVRNHDASLAAAALQRVAQNGNENEIMNSSGYDFSKGDFKSFIEDIFVDKLKISKEQALAIATDVGFIAEKSRHYNIMRPTTVDASTGHREWQDEDDQTGEIVSEMDKMDAEDVARRTNRLGYGDEIVGYNAGIRAPKKDAPKEEWAAYRQKKAAYFRRGGSREFRMSASGVGYLAGKYGSSFRGIEQARYNDSFAIRATEEANKPVFEKMKKMLKGTTRVDHKGNDRTFDDFVEVLDDFAGAKARADVDYIEQAIKLMKQLQE